MEIVIREMFVSFLLPQEPTVIEMAGSNYGGGILTGSLIMRPSESLKYTSAY